MKRTLGLLGTVLVIVVAAVIYLGTTAKGKIVLVRLLANESTPRLYASPGKTTWKPEGVRRISRSDNINARQVTFGRLLHTDTRSSDEVATVFAPAIVRDWTAEPNFFVAEGPVFDSQGNIYFSPVFPPEDVIVVSIEPEQGKRRWVLEGFSAGAGTPLILLDPDTGEDVVYVGSYDRAVAMTTDGEILWDVSSGLPELIPAEVQANQHSFGINYHMQSDSLVAAMGDGHVYILDRKTGKSLLENPFMMPGAPTKVSNFALPENIAAKANKDISHMVGHPGDSYDPIGAVLHATAGELQKISNFFSIDSDSGRIWIAATLPDEEDGESDGWSDFAALYGMDLVCDEIPCRLDIKVVFQVPGGTASTPTISADGKRVYVADAFGLVYAVNADTGNVIWSIDVKSKVQGSLVVSADNGEIFANTKTDIKKVFDRGDHAELAWTAKMDMYEPGRFMSNFKALGAEVGANGLAFTGAVGFVSGKQKFPLKLGAGLIDRKTGEVIYFADGAEDSVSSMVSGPDGGMYIGNSPLRRVLGRQILGESKSPQPVTGGITRFKPIHQNLIIRDALWAAANRARNAATFVDSHRAEAEEDIYQIRQLLDQCNRVAPAAIKEGGIDLKKWKMIEEAIEQVKRRLVPENTSLIRVSEILEHATDLAET
jgi:outer membrane protein assembly factor BamB